MSNEQALKIDLAIKDHVLKSYNFTQDLIVIGRIPTADIFIDNTGVSREHTRIERTIGGPYVVKDLNSTNGTFLNDERITEATLKNKDVISIGKFSLKVTLASEDEKPKAERGKITRDDLDGTTVLSTSQLASLRASLEKEKENKARQQSTSPSSPPPIAEETSQVPLNKVLIWGGLILLIGILIGVYVL